MIRSILILGSELFPHAWYLGKFVLLFFTLITVSSPSLQVKEKQNTSFYYCNSRRAMESESVVGLVTKREI